MPQIMIRPDLRTAGGEFNDIVINDRYAGNLSLVYRERERISGSLQLEKHALSRREKEQIEAHVHRYIEALAEAMHVNECEVVVTFSPYDHIIATEHNVGVIDEFLDEQDFTDADEEVSEFYVYDDSGDTEYMFHSDDEELDETMAYPSSELVDDPMPMHPEHYEVGGERAAYYELIIVDEYEDSVNYHVYDFDQEFIAEAFMTVYEHDVIGEVNWQYEPNDEEMEHVTDLIVSDFDEDQVDSFVIDMKYNGEVIETEELTHQDLLDDPIPVHRDRNEYYIELVRDDADTLTYEMYNIQSGSIPIGTATIDVGSRQMTGFIELNDFISEDDREHIASLLLRELDKDRDCDSLSLSIMHHNRPIDDLLFETEQVE